MRFERYRSFGLFSRPTLSFLLLWEAEIHHRSGNFSRSHKTLACYQERHSRTPGRCAIEEQFYLALPLALLAASRLRLSRRGMWALLGALMVVGITSRGVLWASCGREEIGDIRGYYPKIYYGTLCRFDEFLPGIALALLKNGHPSTWERLVRHGQNLFFIGLGLLFTLFYAISRFYYIEDYGYSFFLTTFGYSLIAMVFSILVYFGVKSFIVALSRPYSWHLSPGALVLLHLSIAQGRRPCTP